MTKPSLPQRLHEAARSLGEGDEAFLVDAQLVGLDGEVDCHVSIGGETRVVRVLWQPEFGTLEVIDPQDDAWEAWVHSDSDTQDYVEELHSRFVAGARARRHGWVRADDVEA